MKRLDTLIETIYRNICFKQTTCNGCIAKNERLSLDNGVYKNNDCCLIQHVCLWDLLQIEKTCVECPLMNTKINSCDLLCNNYKSYTSIHPLRYYGYWGIKLDD